MAYETMVTRPSISSRLCKNSVGTPEFHRLYASENRSIARKKLKKSPISHLPNPVVPRRTLLVTKRLDLVLEGKWVR